MSSNNHYITSTVVLRPPSIVKDDQIIFTSAKKGLDFLNEAYEELAVGYPRFYKMDALSKLGIVAADVLLKNRLSAAADDEPEKAGLVLSNRNGSIEADVQYLEASRSYPSPALFVYTLPNIVIGEISIRYKFKGENAFFISDVFDAEWIHWYVTDLMYRNLLETCVCGWVDVAGDQLDGCLFLVESDTSKTGVTFAIENLNSIYKKSYGK